MKFKFLLSVLFLVFASTTSHATLSQNEKNLKGIWFNQSTSGQGVIADVLENSGGNTVFMSWYTHTANGQNKLWLIFQKASSLQQSTSQSVDLFVAKNLGTNGQTPKFNQPPAVEVQKVGTATIQLSTATNLRITFNFDSGFQNDPRWGVASGEMNLVKFTGSNNQLTQNELNLIGTWYNSQTNGQGIQISIVPGTTTNTLFIAWYTYTNTGEKLWLIFQGSTTPNSTSHVLDLFVAKNLGQNGQPPRFNQPPIVDVQKVGTASLLLQSPTSLRIEFAFDSAFQNDPRWANSPRDMNLTRIGAPPVPTTNIDTMDRNAVVNAYRTRHQAPIPDAQWTGNLANCIAGNTSLQFQQRVISQVNYYRDMAGLPQVTLSIDNSKFQEAALIMSANNRLSHAPDSSWRCYTPSGREGASKSNLSLGLSGPGTVNWYIDDYGDPNYAVGHRRWILHPHSSVMATGDTPNSNSLGVLIEFNNSSAREFVAWPSPGYFPSNILPKYSQRWSFSVSQADFSQTQISMRNITTGQVYAITKEQLSNAYGENTVVWRPEGFNYNPPTQDENIQITISNVLVGGIAKNYQYNVVVINAN